MPEETTETVQEQTQDTKPEDSNSKESVQEPAKDSRRPSDDLIQKEPKPHNFDKGLQQTKTELSELKKFVKEQFASLDTKLAPKDESDPEEMANRGYVSEQIGGLKKEIQSLHDAISNVSAKTETPRPLGRDEIVRTIETKFPDIKDYSSDILEIVKYEASQRLDALGDMTEEAKVRVLDTMSSDLLENAAFKVRQWQAKNAASEADEQPEKEKANTQVTEKGAKSANSIPDQRPEEDFYTRSVKKLRQARGNPED